MEQEKYYFRIGVLVSVAIAVLLAVIGWLSATHKDQNHITYAIFFKGSVEGLSLGSPVTLKGIPVGQVKAIEFVSYENDLIRVLVDVVDTAPVRANTVASLHLQGITGGALIALENAGVNMEFLRRKKGQKYIVIASKQSSLEKVFTTAPELLEKLSALTEQGQKLLSDDNIKILVSLLSSVDQSANSISQVLVNDKAKSLGSAMYEANQLLVEGKITLREARMLIRMLREDPSVIIRGVKDTGKTLP